VGSYFRNSWALEAVMLSELEMFFRAKSMTATLKGEPSQEVWGFDSSEAG
jgi:hypothetical protein